MNSPKICFDRTLPQDRLRAFRFTGPVVMRLVAPRNKQWINGTILRVRFIGGAEEQKEIVKKEAGWWGEVANIKFVFNDHPSAEVRISFNESDGAWSYIGTDCASIPLDQPTMNLGFLDEGTAAHEFGHCLGFSHEHQNPVGGIKWNEPAVVTELSGPPNFWDKDTIHHNVLKKYSVNQIRGTVFDPKSIMLYFFPAYWTLNGVATSQNNQLSDLDKSFAGSPAMYPFPIIPPGVYPALPIKQLTPNHKSRTQATIRKPGEEDLFRFTVGSNDAGRYVINTRGKTNVALRLFGPDVQTRLISEDDDSGLDTNAEINADLIPGEYWIQVRHSVQSGTGKYTVKVFFKK